MSRAVDIESQPVLVRKYSIDEDTNPIKFHVNVIKPWHKLTMQKTSVQGERSRVRERESE